jgi:uncharacterized metal-binding protein YceD (DUF177 family)
MPLTVNLRHLEEHGLRLQGELPVAELDIDPHDEVIRVVQPLEYDLEVQRLDKSLLVQGRLHLTLDCQCVRCLKPFPYLLKLDNWTCHLPLQGEDQVAVVNDCVDLTPQMREDILLEFPRHPVCGSECRGVPKTSIGEAKNTSTAGKTEPSLPAWAELNKLKL